MVSRSSSMKGVLGEEEGKGEEEADALPRLPETFRTNPCRLQEARREDPHLCPLTKELGGCPQPQARRRAAADAVAEREAPLASDVASISFDESLALVDASLALVVDQVVEGMLGLPLQHHHHPYGRVSPCRRRQPRFPFRVSLP